MIGETPALRASIAGANDAGDWLRLKYQAGGEAVPADLSGDIERFLSEPPEVANNRFLVRLGAEPVACWAFVPAGTVLELRPFYITEGQVVAHGPSVVASVVKEAAGRGSAITVEYPEAYSPLFTGAGFKQNTRTCMKMPLSTYEPRLVVLPAGIDMRHPRPEDQAAASELAFRNYMGTADAEMVSTSREQASNMMRAIFGSEYARFSPETSFLAEDGEGRLVGSVLVGDMTREPEQSIFWILDISAAPEWRGKGLGKALLAASLNAAKGSGFSSIGLAVTIGNEPAHNLYRSYGFSDYGALMYEAILMLD